MDVKIGNLEQLIREEFTLTKNLIFKELVELKELIGGLKQSKSKELEDDDQNPFSIYKVEELAGEGAYGKVYMVFDRDTYQPLAMKVIDLVDNLISPSLSREISSLLDLRHDNIVKLEKVHIHGSCIYLMMEFVENNLNMVIQEGQINPERVKAWLKELLCAVAFIHKRGILHRDLKPENILIDANQKLKVADLGSVKGFIDDAELSPNVTTVQFRAPEVLLGSTSYGRPIDIWSIGCIFFEMVERTSLFGSDYDEISEISVISEIFRKMDTPSKECLLRLLPNFPGDLDEYPVANEVITSKLDKEGNDLMLKLLKLDPEDRICAEEALKHSYFSLVTEG